MLVAFWRVLKPNGSLYLFCSSKLAADTEILIRQRFDILSHIVWAKPYGTWMRTNKESLRAFFPSTERIIFAGHYGAEGFAKGNTGYASKCKAIKEQVFMPLIDYFKHARKQLGVSAKEINDATHSQMCSHWFSSSQWKLPTEIQYKQLQSLFKQKGGALRKNYSDLQRTSSELNENYEVLIKQYEHLKQAYQLLRRPFFVSKAVPYTDVWHYSPVAYYPGKHPCEKPSQLLEHVINASTREGDIVLDAFMGSGATGKACLKLNRRFIGIEMEEENFDNINI